MAGTSLADEIASQLERRLMDAVWTPSQKLPSERELSDEFGVSRPIIREALKTLRHWGLVEIHPGRGAFAARSAAESSMRAVEYSIRGEKLSFFSLLEGRLFLESRIAELAAERRTDDDLARLQCEIEQMRTCWRDDIPAFERADLAFHLALASATSNRLYRIWLQPIIKLLEQTRQGVLTLGEVRKRAIRWHQEILAGVRGRDPDRARAAMHRHLRDFATDTAAAMKLGILPPGDLGDLARLFADCAMEDRAVKHPQ